MNDLKSFAMMLLRQNPNIMNNPQAQHMVSIIQNGDSTQGQQIAEQASLINALNLAQSQANQNQYLISQLRPCPQPCYPVQNPYASANWGNNCGCGNACGCGC